MGRVRRILGRNIVADSGACHGKPTFTGTRIMVWQILKQVASEKTSDAIVADWAGRGSKEAISEAIVLAKQKIVDDNPKRKLA
jgi:uncharacterized protein (DUF433 family)